MGAPTSQELQNEKDMANEFLRIRGGRYEVLEPNGVAHIDRLWFKDNEYRFVEFRNRTSYTWDYLSQHSMFLDARKLENVFYFVVRDKLGVIKFVLMTPERLVYLRNTNEYKNKFQVADQHGALQWTVLVPYNWFEDLT